MTLQIGMVTIDCADPGELAGFWTRALSLEVSEDWGEFVMLGPDTRGLAIGLQRVPEPKIGKNRVHLDLSATDRSAEVRRLVELGATVVGEHQVPGFGWTVLTDPVGNQFCVSSPDAH